MLYEEVRQTVRQGQQARYGAAAWLPDWEQAKERIGLKLIGCAGKGDFLERTPHRHVLDLALVCYLSFEMEEGRSGVLVIQRDSLLQWGISEEALFHQAEKNEEIFFTPEYLPMEQMITALMIPEREKEEGEQPGLCEPFHGMMAEMPLYVITNRHRSLGASAILSPGLLRRLTEETGWDECYLLPSSIHEMILLPVTMADAETLRWIVRDVNESTVRREDLLSYSVYRYHREQNAIGLEGGEEWYPLEG